MAVDAPEGNPLHTLFRRYSGPHARDLGIGLFSQGLSRVPDKLPSLMLGIAIDAVFLQDTPYRLPLVPGSWLPTGRWEQFLLTLGVLALAFPAAAALEHVSRRYLGRFSAEFQHEVRTDVFDSAQRLEMGFFDDRDTGEVMSILNDDVRQLQAFVYGVLHRIATFGVGLLVAFAILLWLNWQLTLLVLVVPGILGGMSWWFSKVMEEKHLRIRERVAEVNTRLNNNVEGIGVIKAFNTEEMESERVRTASARHRDAQWDAHLVRTGTEPVMRTVCNSASSIALLVGGYWVLFGPPLFFTGSLTPGALYVFLSYVFAFVTPMEQLTNVVDDYQNSKAAATRLVGIVDDERIEISDDGDRLVDPDGEVTYEDVTFAYEGRDEPALRDVDLTAEPGETVGVVGPTGAGKSTLLKLLFRFYDPSEPAGSDGSSDEWSESGGADAGTVRIDGRDVRDYSLESLRASIGYVSQDPFLFHGTVRENVAYAVPEIDDEAVREAATLAGAHEFVADLPEGYDTVVGDRGVKLSGGQRQRIAIARAILRDPEILVFDEATSHVDNETEALIQEAMDSVAADRTTFVIAHRLSTVRDADEILVLDDGEIAERGTHVDLLDAGGLYADLWRIQVGEVEALPDAFLERVRRGDAA